jgi:hypothetical protein
MLYRRWKKRLVAWKYSGSILIVFIVFIISTQLPLWIYILLGRTASKFEITDTLKPFYYIYLSWQYPMFFSFPFFLLGILLIAFSSKIYSYFTSHRTQDSIQITDKNNKFRISRKQFLFSIPGLAVDTMPFVLSTTSLTAMTHGSSEFAVDRIEIKIPDLHRDLSGFKILQISDIHAGNLITDEYLSRPLEIIKNIKADIMVVTGDIIDNNNYFLPIAGKFFTALENHFPQGIYGILGNHDFIDNGEFIYKSLVKTPIHILKNESILIKRGYGKFNLTGLVYPERFQKGRSEYLMNTFSLTSEKLNKNIPSIVLNHYPADFDDLISKSRADLVLSGHTHGGQIRLFNDSSSSIIPETIIKYISGFYRNGNSQLYVNRGLGHWYPLRINCPPEITLITLV